MLTQPVRLRLSRRKGFDLQAHSLETNGLTARRVTRPGLYGNIYKVEKVAVGHAEAHDWAGRCSSPLWTSWVDSRWRGKAPSAERAAEMATVAAQTAAALYRVELRQFERSDPDGFRRWLAPLRGRNLACWCKPGEPCHADVLLELSNRPTCEAVE